ncbi:hypothetical protein CVU75_01720 [Candidatus Dependentiae bacterium HGW-Dependentiae-1]|nr:MAG: hypothetical protein CVU75_01720 [Candidatus Dependentiae bacterium HGW-Dependentiae-1]
MGFFSDLNQWLLAEWLWSMTWGLYHVPLATLCMIFLFRFYMKMSLRGALWQSLKASFFALVIYTLYVPAFLIYWSGLETDWVADPMPAALYLGFIYGVLQSSFFWLQSLWFPMDMQRVLIVVALSNFIAALVIFKLALMGLSL